MILIGVGLALILLFIVQFTSAVSQTPLSSIGDVETDTEVAPKTDTVDTGLTPVFFRTCLLYTSPSPRDKRQSRMPSSA